MAIHSKAKRIWRPRLKLRARKRSEIFDAFGRICVYCGDPATTLDHFVPWTQNADNSTGNLLPACGPCNSAAGNRVFMSFEEKRAAILDARARRDGLVEVYCPKGCGVTYARLGEPAKCPDCGEAV